jgi:choline-sulfatase
LRPAERSSTRPNLLLITVDTPRADYLGAYGSSAARTPHIGRLAREDSLFEQAARQILRALD